MSFIDQFLGKRVEIPEDLRYDIKQGLWAKPDGNRIVFGLTEPAMVLIGGLNDLEWLVEEGQTVTQGEAVAFAITGKIMYIDSPLAGTIRFNAEAKETPSLVFQEPYGRGWLFRIESDGNVEGLLKHLVGDRDYMESLRGTEGFKNPEGKKGGVSGMCKAVYSGIREQKIGE